MLAAVWINPDCKYTAYMLAYSYMDVKDAGRLGAEITNKLLTPEKRSRAAKKAWKTRRANLKEKTQP